MDIKALAFERSKATKREPVPMPEWGEGVVVYVREMSARERDDYEASQLERSKKGKGLVNFRARLVAMTAQDEGGKRIFGDEDVDDLGKIPARDIRKLFDVATKLNALTAEDETDLEKNS